MKRVLIFMFGLAVVSAAAFAGDYEGKRSGDRMARMQEHLGLSAEQVEQIREIRENGGSREEIHAVFTDEQRELMQERRAQMKASGEKGRGGKGHGRGHGHPRGPDQQGDNPDNR